MGEGNMKRNIALIKQVVEQQGYIGPKGNMVLIDQIVRQQEEIHMLRGLMDGAYDIVALWKAETPSQQKWRAEWMAKARKNGAVPSP